MLRVGAIQVFNDRAQIGGKELLTRTLPTEAAILKLSYQISPKQQRLAEEILEIADALQLAEVIFYNQILSEAEARIVESYLAMKYSVNITENEKEDLRNYVAVFDKDVWNHSTDFLYNKEVLALGRIDQIGFTQHQTYSSDSKSIQLSFSTNSSLGEQPDVTINDNALVILSKEKNGQFNQVPCGAADYMQPWKLSLYNWTDAPSTLYLTVDTPLTFEEAPYLTDGINTIPISSATVNNQTQLSITLPTVIDEESQSLFIVWEKTPECEPLCTVNSIHCDDVNAIPNELKMELNEFALPANVQLINYSTNEVYEYMLTQELGAFQNLAEGQYGLVIENNEVQLINKTVAFESCENSNTTTDGPLLVQESKSDNDGQGIGIANDAEITVFPNPAYKGKTIHFKLSGFNNQNFTVEAMDSQGKLIHQNKFNTTESNNQYELSFQAGGAYFVRFSTESYTEVKQVIIN